MYDFLGLVNSKEVIGFLSKKNHIIFIRETMTFLVNEELIGSKRLSLQSHSIQLLIQLQHYTSISSSLEYLVYSGLFVVAFLSLTNSLSLSVLVFLPLARSAVLSRESVLSSPVQSCFFICNKDTKIMTIIHNNTR